MTYEEARMTDKEIIKALEHCSVDDCSKDCPMIYTKGICSIELPGKALEVIKHQQEHIKELEIIIGLQRKRKYYNKFVKEVWQKEHGKLSYPDFDEIYKRYFEQQERFDRIEKAINEYFEKQCEIRTEGKKEYPAGLIQDLLTHNKKICKIVKAGGKKNET